LIGENNSAIANVVEEDAAIFMVLLFSYLRKMIVCCFVCHPSGSWSCGMHYLLAFGFGGDGDAVAVALLD
jgi:hypothetical protein